MKPHMLKNLLEKVKLAVNELLNTLLLKVTYHPQATISVTLVICIVCCAGFLRMNELNQIEKLYIPQNSISMKNLQRGHESFPIKVRTNTFIIKYSNNSSILKKTVFIECLKLYNYVLNISGMENICIKNKRGHCASVSILQLFQFSKDKLNEDFISQLVAAYANDTFLFENGRTAKYTYPRVFGHFEKYNDTYFDAKSLKTQFLLNFPDKTSMFEREKVWEGKFLSLMEKQSKRLKSKGISLLYIAGRSTDDNIIDAAMNDVPLISVSIISMFIFCTLMLGDIRNKVESHCLLSLGGVLTLIIGIGAAFGFLMLVGYPFVAFTGVLPFLVLGVGIDDIFIIVLCFDRQYGGSYQERVVKTMKLVGASITMTTMTDVIAFIVSSMSDFPAIKYFSIYITFSLLLCFILICTMFVSLLVYDSRRIMNKRYDFLPCIKVPDTLHTQVNKTRISTKVMRAYGRHLMRHQIRAFWFIVAVALFSVSIYGAMFTRQEFDEIRYSKPGSYYEAYKNHHSEAYSNSFPINIICDEVNNYFDPIYQQQLIRISSIAAENRFIQKNTINWMSAFIIWSKKHNFTSHDRNASMVILKSFLRENPSFYVDLKFSKDFTKIESSRIVFFSGERDDDMSRKSEMISLRDELKAKSNMKCYAISLADIFTEEIVEVLYDTIRTLAISGIIIFMLTLIYFRNVLVSFLVFMGFGALTVELMAMMYILDIPLNSISMVTLIMAIGFSVDYSAHVAHAFVFNEIPCPIERIVFVLETTGASVFLAGMSTFIGVLVTSIASSEIFRVFFKMTFGIIALGLLHGLVFLPVLLATFFTLLEYFPSRHVNLNKINKKKKASTIATIFYNKNSEMTCGGIAMNFPSLVSLDKSLNIYSSTICNKVPSEPSKCNGDWK